MIDSKNASKNSDFLMDVFKNSTKIALLPTNDTRMSSNIPPEAKNITWKYKTNTTATEK